MALDASGAGDVSASIAFPGGQFPSGVSLGVAVRVAPEIAEASLFLRVGVVS